MEPCPVDVPLPVDMVCVAALSQHMHPDDLDLMEKAITWRQVPEFPGLGRSAWLKLTHPFEAVCGNDVQIIRSLKLKGVGLRDHLGGIHRPCNDTYRRPDIHLGIDEHGGFCELSSTPAPMGGLALTRAVTEHTTAYELCAVGPISQVPLFVYRYVGLGSFRDDTGSVSDLSVVVTGLPTDIAARADSLVYYSTQDPAIQLQMQDWTRQHTGNSQFDWTDAQIALWREYGKRLRQFHRRGFYRHNAHPCNLGLGQHGVFLVDLDSTRHMLECPPRLRALQALRDAAGAVFHIIADTLRSTALTSADSATATHRAIIDAFLGAYFPDVATHTFEEVKAVACEITSELWGIKWALGVGGGSDLNDPVEGQYQEFMLQRRSQLGRGIDAPELFCRLMPGLATPYSLSQVAYQGPAYRNEIDLAAEAFLRKRQVQLTSLDPPNTPRQRPAARQPVADRPPV